MKLEIGKTYLTRGGELVTIETGREQTMREHGIDYRNDLYDHYAFGGTHPQWGRSAWAEDGRYLDSTECSLDLVEEVGS